MKKLIIFATILLVMAGCQKRNSGKGWFENGKGWSVDATVDSKAQTLSFKYDKDVTISYLNCIRDYHEGIVMNETYTKDSTKNVCNYTGAWYVINAYDDHLEVRVSQNRSADSRSLFVDLFGQFPYMGECTVAQSGAQ